MHETLDRARRQRKQLGDLLLMLQLLHPWLNKAFLTRDPPAVFYTYAGFDLMAKWAKYLLDDLRPYSMLERLSEAFGVTVDEVERAQRLLDQGVWQYRHVAAAVDRLLLGNVTETQTVEHPSGRWAGKPYRMMGLEHVFASIQRDRVPRGGWPASELQDHVGGDAVREYLDGVKGVQEPAFWRRPSSAGMPRRSAMPARLRRREAWMRGAPPTLHYCCQMCEAEFPNRKSFDEHVDAIHGTSRWYQVAVINRTSLAPYVVSPTEKRKVVSRFSISQQFATIDPENERYAAPPPIEVQKLQFWRAVAGWCACHVKSQSSGRLAPPTDPSEMGAGTPWHVHVPLCVYEADDDTMCDFLARPAPQSEVQSIALKKEFFHALSRGGAEFVRRFKDRLQSQGRDCEWWFEWETDVDAVCANLDIPRPTDVAEVERLQKLFKDQIGCGRYVRKSIGISTHATSDGPLEHGHTARANLCINSDQAKDGSAGGEGVEDGGESELRIEDSEEEINEFETEEEEGLCINSDQAKDRSAGGEGVEDGGESEVRIEDSEEEINEFETEEEEEEDVDHLAI